MGECGMFALFNFHEFLMYQFVFWTQTYDPSRMFIFYCNTVVVVVVVVLCNKPGGIGLICNDMVLCRMLLL